MPSRILVVGAIQGHLRIAFEKIAKIHSKTNFSFAIVVGDLFGESANDQEVKDLKELLNGSLIVPLPTYFMLGNLRLPESVIERLETQEEVCPNLFYLGRKGTLKTTDGVRIVALGGKLVQGNGLARDEIGKYDPLYVESEVRGLIGVHSCDILVTNQWPADITAGSTQPIPEAFQTDQGITCISSLCSILKPRYHFSSTPIATWEREPFTHPIEYDSFETKPTTRFRSLASVDKPSKAWVSAFTLDPTTPPSAVPEATSSPFRLEASAGSRKRGNLDNNLDSYQRYGSENRYTPNKRLRKNDRTAKDQCFFCIANPEFNGHMVVSIGDESIVTIPKGPLPLPSTFPALSASGHALIIPQYHAADETAGALRDAQEVDAEFAEMTRYRKALCKMILDRSNGTLGAVCWDANRTGIRHMHWQLMPVSSDLIRKGLVEAAFKAYREKNHYPPFQSCASDSKLSQKSDYFRVWIWTPPELGKGPVEAADLVKNGADSEGAEKSIFFPLPPNESFNIWFGREVMANLLKLENWVDWKMAAQTFEEEEREAEAFKKDFEKYDFAMVV